MGSEESKPIVDPPEDWEPKGATKSFEIISPCSDLSNPSDFNRVRYNPHPPHPQQLRYQNQPPHHRAAEASTPFSPNAKPLSRKGYKNNLPIAVKVRKSRSSSTSGDGKGEVLPPGAFYFPTKESERRLDRGLGFVKKERRSDQAANLEKHKDGNNKENKFQRVSRQAAKKIMIKKKIALKMIIACLDEKSNRREEDGGDVDDEPKLISAEELTMARPREERKPSTSTARSRRRSEQIEDVPLRKFKKDSEMQKGNNDISDNVKYDMDADEIMMENQRNQMERATSAALHQEDAYFDRLSLSSSANHGSSPFVNNGVACNRVTSILRSSLPDSIDTPINSPISDMFSANNSIPDMRDNEALLDTTKNNINSSPVSSLMRFYTNTGPMDSSSPESYCSDENEADTQVQVFSDEQSDTETPESEDLKRQSHETHSSLYTAESKSYKKVDGKDLKLLVHDDKVNHQEESDIFPHLRPEVKKVSAKNIAKSRKKSEDKEPKMSKLESLFRPILPALSTDDAQSLSSYDPYEIKVTESAPGVIQAANYISLGLRNNELAKLSPSMSILSIDSQQDPSPSLAKHMVSNQAQRNGEFLFANDYGPVVIAQDPNKLRGSATTFSISTAAARSRFSQRSTQKGVDIPMRGFKETDDGSVDHYSHRSERHVRFSEDSTPLSKETDLDGVEDVSDVEGDLLDAVESFAEAEETLEKLDSEEYEQRVESNLSGIIEDTNEDTEISVEHEDLEVDQMNYHQIRKKFGTTTACGGSFAESIDLPHFENKLSNLSDTASCRGRKSSESAQSVRTHRTIDSIPEEDEKVDQSPDDTSIHWTYNETGVTPYVEGKSTANATKSPYYRFKDAKNKFNTQDLPRRKSPGKGRSPKNTKVVKRRSSISAASPAKILRQGSGGLVSTRIHELNSRVTEIRKLKRMRKKMKNPRLHTHNFDNKQPVRNRALINYKTSTFSANTGMSNSLMAAKFNVIPDVDDDEDSLFSSGTSDIADSKKEDVEDDDATQCSRMSEMTGVTSVATVRQIRNHTTTAMLRCSMSSGTTASSGFMNIKKQVFRGSDGTISLKSNRSNRSESTTLSSIIHKENENYLPFRETSHHIVKPSEQHFGAPPASHYLPPSKEPPVQAMKWRTLAAAAAEKDALKASCSKPKRTLATRSNNCKQYL